MNTTQFYDSISSEYTGLLERTVPCYREMMVHLMKYIPDGLNVGNILELGCGTGNLTYMLREKYPPAHIEAVDFSESIIRECRTRMGATDRITYNRIDFRDMSFPAGSFDLIISSISIHHLEDADKEVLFQKLYTFLKSGGVFTFSDQCKGITEEIYLKEQMGWKSEAFESGASENDWKTWMEHQEMHDHHASIPDQMHWLEQAGFRNVDVVWKYLLWTVFYSEK